MATGALVPQPVGPLAHVMIGALDEAALYISRAQDRATAIAETTEIVERMIDSLAA
jgi:hypothetical protein